MKLGEFRVPRRFSITSKVDFVITNPTHFAVVIKADKQNQCFILLAKGEDERAQQIKKIAISAQKLVVESPEDARAIFREFNEGDSFDKYNSALIDIMEEFRLIETGSFHRV